MKFSLPILSATFFLFTAAQSQTLEEAVCLMLEFEPELNAAEYDTLSAREDQAIIRSERLPRVTLDGSSGYSYRERTTDGLLRSGEDLFARQLSLSIRQLVYDGGTLKNQTKAARNALLAQ
ncbi:MAG: TolC family protein, partial [Verrucomicrobiota bacterium]